MILIFAKNTNAEGNVFGVERFRSRDSANVGKKEKERDREGKIRKRKRYRAYDDDNVIIHE